VTGHKQKQALSCQLKAGLCNGYFREHVMSLKLKPFLALTIISLILIIVSAVPKIASAQSRLETAKRRSQNAAKTIEVITGMSEDETIPAELLKSAYAIGVFPDVVMMNLLFSKGMKGYGVICSRQAAGWSLPAYYAFGSTQMTWKVARFKSFDLVVLFMNKDTVNWFQEGRLQLKDLRAGVGGPIGKLTPHASRDISGTYVIMYTLIDGKLKGMNVEADLLDEAVINPDNNINKAVYGMKGREVLTGTTPKSLPPAPGVTAFQEILNQKFPVSK
jgi:lipid-binding SYLF domain-containing protein